MPLKRAPAVVETSATRETSILGNIAPRHRQAIRNQPTRRSVSPEHELRRDYFLESFRGRCGRAETRQGRPEQEGGWSRGEEPRRRAGCGLAAGDAGCGEAG